MRSGILGLACLALAIPPANAHVVRVASPVTVAVVAIQEVQVLPVLNRHTALAPEESRLARPVMTRNELRRQRPAIAAEALRRQRPTIAADVNCAWFMRLVDLAAGRYSLLYDVDGHGQSARIIAAQQVAQQSVPHRREWVK